MASPLDDSSAVEVPVSALIGCSSLSVVQMDRWGVADDPVHAEDKKPRPGEEDGCDMENVAQIRTGAVGEPR
jgi:hypothetical protein